VAHPSQLAFFERAVVACPQHFAGSVLDIGAYDVNGGPHRLFSADRYVGADLIPGPNVSVIGAGESLDYANDTFDVTMSSECFEHTQNWMAIVDNMIRMTRPSGLLIFTAAGIGRAEHGTQRTGSEWASPGTIALKQDWYRNLSSRQVHRVLRRAMLAEYYLSVDKENSDICVLGIKASAKVQDLAAARDVWQWHREQVRDRRYPGPLGRRLIVQAFGDRGLAAAQRTKAMLHPTEAAEHHARRS